MTRGHGRVRPRRLVHRGHVQAGAVWISSALLGEAGARRRVLACWRPGVRVQRLGGGFLCIAPAVEPWDAEFAPGLPLTSERGCLASAPLFPREWEHLDPMPGSVLLVQAGELTPVPLASLPTVQPAAWLDLSEMALVVADSLGSPPLTIAVSEPPRREVREVLSGIPRPDPRQAEVLAALRKPRPRLPGGARGVLERLLRGLAGAMDRREQAAGGSMGVPGPPPPPSWLRKRINQWLLRSSLAGVLHHQHARYMRDMLDLFDRGDLLEALRHAIPLSDGPATGNAEPYLGLPRPRRDLSLTMQRGGGAALFADDSLHNHLKALYRQAFERLEQQGRIDEAAFVLVELLDDPGEAIAFLERQGRLRTAAELAEARNLPSGLGLRLWFLAGELDRVLLLARRAGAFSEAVALLERSDRDRGHLLRRVWAQVLAEAGDYGSAVDALWPVTEARPRTLRWLEAAIAVGGVAGARMAARRLGAWPERDTESREWCQRLFDGRDAEDAEARLAFAIEMVSQASSSALAPLLARLSVRALLGDHHRGHIELSSGLLRRLLHLSDDSALRADVPPTRAAGPGLMEREDAVSVVVAATDVGGLAVCDVAPLPDGRLLVALGEAGARVLTRSGGTAAVITEPAHHLVLADNGARALLLAPRGRVIRIGRLDLLTFKCAHWCDAPIDAWAPDYDGERWFVAHAREVLMVDALHPEMRALWRTAELPGPMTNLARSARCLQGMVEVPAEPSAGDLGSLPPAPAWQHWSFSLPDLQLRTRPQVPGPRIRKGWGLEPGGERGFVTVEDGVCGLRLGGGGLCPLPIADQTAPLGLWMSDPWVAVSAPDSGGASIFLIGASAARSGNLSGHALVRLEKAQRVAGRLTARALTIGDDLGRLVVLDLKTGAVMRNLRVR